MTNIDCRAPLTLTPKHEMAFMRFLRKFEAAADRKWGKTQTGNSSRAKLPCSPKRLKAREYLQANPMAFNEDAAAELGLSVDTVRAARADLGLVDHRRVSPKRQRICEAIRRDPHATASEIAERTGTSRKYVGHVMAELEGASRIDPRTGEGSEGH